MSEAKADVFRSFTKEVLVRYLCEKVFLSEGELLLLRPELMFLEWGIECERAKKLMDEALAGSKASKDRSDWFKWQKKFDEAQKVFDDAQELYGRAEHLRQKWLN